MVKRKVKKVNKKLVNFEIKYFILFNWVEDNYPDIIDEFENSIGGKDKYGKKKDSEEEQE